MFIFTIIKFNYLIYQSSNNYCIIDKLSNWGLQSYTSELAEVAL